MLYLNPGSCAAAGCAPGLLPVPKEWSQQQQQTVEGCVSQQTIDAVQQAIAAAASATSSSRQMGGASIPGLRYPVRALPHS